MSDKTNVKILGFEPKENASDMYIKKYADNYAIEIDFAKNTLNFGGKICIGDKTTQNITKPEDWVVLECVNRLLEKGYNPENIQLEKVYPAGHGFSGRLDICVTRDDGSEYLLIECKTYGKEFDKEFTRMKKDGGQLFTYFKFSNKPDVIMLYTSQITSNELVYRNEIVKIEEDHRSGDVKDFYQKWNKLTKDNGIFDPWVECYNYESKALTPKLLKPIQEEDSSLIFNQFLEILRHNVVSDKPNAFNKIFTLFLCKVYDEKTTKHNEELKFQWIESKDASKGENAYVDFLIRLSDLYKNGMLEFLEKEITDFSQIDFERKYKHLDDSIKKDLLKEFNKIRLEKNNEFAIKEVFDKQSFLENAKIVKEVVELLQGFRIRYNKRQQYLSNFFELLLTTGLKQESGQFFTPVPVAQFIIKSLPIDKIMDEKLEKGERNNLLPYVIDYAAGSGHFLTESMHEIQKHLNEKNSNDYIADTSKKIKSWKEDHFDWATQYVYGIEKDYRLVKVGKVGCYLHGDGLANVLLSDGLGSFKKTKEYKGLLRENKTDFPQDNGQFDILISNPPYSVSSFKRTTADYYTKEDFELYDKLTDNSSEIECLFIERTKQLLKDDGVAGVILPSSILSNTGIYSKSREIILQYFDIVGITELGSNTFMATGTNTVVLFLRRRNNYEHINLKIAVERFFTTHRDVTLNGIENPVAKYLNHVWEGLALEDYLSLVKREPSKVVVEHELYKEYQKKLKAKNDKEFWNLLQERETQKLLYFIIAYPQKVVLVKSGEKDAEKRFLGYEFSNRRGSEGIHPIQRGKNIEECTQLFDAEVFDNPTKASTYIYKAFLGDFDTPIDECLQKNISRHNLIDMMTFDRVEFEKNISLSVKKKVKIESKWDVYKLNQLVSIVRGASPRPIREYITTDVDGVNWIKIGDVKPDSKYITETKEKITIEGAKKSRFVKKGDFILSNSMSFGRPYIMEIEGCIHDGWLLLSDFTKNLNKDYLYNILSDKIVQEQFISAASGGTSVDNLNIDKVAYTQIPLPPLDIQQKIVAEIEVLEAKEKRAREEVEGLKLKTKEIFESINSLNKVSLEDISENLDNLRKPVTKGYREKGEIPYYGASGIIDYVSNYILDDFVLLVSEDGANLKARTSPIAFTVNGKIWVNNHAHILKFRDKATHKLVEIYLNKTDISEYITGQAQPKLNQQNLNAIKIPLPPLAKQQKIVSQIEKIEAQIALLEGQIGVIPQEKEAVLRAYL